MKYIVMAGAFAGLLAFTVVPTPQEPPVTAGPGVYQPITFEGCLRPGTRKGEFALSAGGNAYLVVPGIGVELEGHVNEQVQLTGSVENGSRGPLLRVSAMRLVAEVCSAP